MPYTTGDTVVHPRHGIATIQGITTRGVGKRRRSYLELAFASTSMKVFVPMESVDAVGIRELSTKQQAAAILTVLARPADVPEKWTERHASTTLRMRSTELVQASMVVRDLTRHAQHSGKPLSGAEHADLQTCLNTVASELSLVLEISPDEARTLILQQVQAGN